MTGKGVSIRLRVCHACAELTEGEEEAYTNDNSISCTLGQDLCCAVGHPDC